MKFFHFSVGERKESGNILGVRKKRPTYLSLINFFVFCVFFFSLWCFSFDMTPALKLGLGASELEVILLQSVSFLLVLCAFQMPTKQAKGWRPILLTMSFVALSESSLIALLTPVV